MEGSARTKLALNFFFFLLTDEELATHAASRALHLFNKKANGKDDLSQDALLVNELLTVLKKTNKKLLKKHDFEIHEKSSSDWSRLNPNAFNRWKILLRNLDEEMKIVLVLRYVLKIPVAVIAEALKVPQGTVLFRIGRGLESMASST